MVIIIWILLFVILIIPYFIFLVRKRSVEFAPTTFGLDRVSFLATVLGGAALGLLLTRELTLHRLGLWTLLLVIPFMLVAILLLLLPRRVLLKVMRPGMVVDERVAAIGAKSARNALAATYLALVAFLVIDGDTLDRNSVVMLLGSGLLVFYASYMFYFYRES